MKVAAQSGGARWPLWMALLACCRWAWACERVHFGPKQSLNIACRCHSQHCDAPLQFQWPHDDSHLLELLSTRSGARFQLRNVSLSALIDSGEGEGEREREGEPEEEGEDAAERVVQVDVNRHQQRVLGYGGALTDSASMLIASRLDADTRRCLMRSYFGPHGLDYNLVRVPIGGTDMSWRAYSYDELPPDGPEHDFELRHFKLQPEDLEFKLPLIREARHIRSTHSEAPGREGACPEWDGEQPLRLLASSWSAPTWMKSNENLVQGQLKESIDGKYYDAYARYLVRFMEEYERELEEPRAAECPFRVWALTPQNEPCTPGRLGYSVVNYNSLNFGPKQMAQFVRYNLIPQLLRHNRTARQLALFIWDDTLLGFDKYKRHLFGAHFDEHESELEEERLKQLKSGYAHFERRTISEYVRGMAVHWYSQALDKLPYRSLFEVRRWLPPRFSLLSTEASFIGRPHPGEWARGEKYARDIIGNLRAGSLGWIDWNLALNLEGGPTWSGNFLDAAILIEDHAHQREAHNNTRSSFYKNPMFYAIGHLSRFIRRGSHVLASDVLINDHRERRNSTHDQQLLAALRQKSQLTPNEQSQLAVLAKEAGWRLVDELEEQTSELLVVASELAREPAQQEPAQKNWRQIALVLLNRANRKLRVKLNVANCKSRVGARTLALELEAKSITSYAFNC